ncbi:MAG: hypothetical protein K6F37_09420 [Lachnospiraceae bacterium]|nr:hypothetical protein [Lachnospiraceae bacterium]
MKTKIKRLFLTLVGVILCSASVGLFQLVAFGVDPFQCFAMGTHIPFSKVLNYGTYYMILSVVFLVADLFLDRHYIGLATFINLFLTGYIVDFSYKILSVNLTDLNMISRILFLLIAIVIMCFGSSMYYTGDLGVSVYDAISLSLADKKLKLKGRVVPFKFIRVVSDLICVIIGFLFGKMPGIGTVITAFFMGPLIDYFNVHIMRPFLHGKNAEEGAGQE